MDPGRVGETGTLTVRDMELQFLSGSMLRLDLTNPADHDVLAFATNVTTTAASVDLDTSGDGVELALNFLGRSPVADTYTLLTGYSNLTGRFVGCE